MWPKEFRTCLKSSVVLGPGPVVRRFLVVTSVLTSAWRQLTSGLRSPDEPDEVTGSITRLRFVWFSSNFVHLPPRQPLENRVCHAPHFLQFFYPRILSDGKPDEKRAMMRNKVLREHTIQKFHTTAPEQLTDQELLLSKISVADLVRKHSGGWDKEHPKCLFCSKAYRHRTFTVQCHMTSQVTGQW